MGGDFCNIFFLVLSVLSCSLYLLVHLSCYVYSFLLSAYVRMSFDTYLKRGACCGREMVRLRS